MDKPETSSTVSESFADDLFDDGFAGGGSEFHFRLGGTCAKRLFRGVVAEFLIDVILFLVGVATSFVEVVGVTKAGGFGVGRIFSPLRESLLPCSLLVDGFGLLNQPGVSILVDGALEVNLVHTVNGAHFVVGSDVTHHGRGLRVANVVDRRS